MSVSLGSLGVKLKSREFPMSGFRLMDLFEEEEKRGRDGANSFLWQYGDFMVSKVVCEELAGAPFPSAIYAYFLLKGLDSCQYAYPYIRSIPMYSIFVSREELLD